MGNFSHVTLSIVLPGYSNPQKLDNAVQEIRPQKLSLAAKPDMHDEIFHFETFRKFHENYDIFQDPLFEIFMKYFRPMKLYNITRNNAKRQEQSCHSRIVRGSVFVS